jgi:hypothetical protein
MAILLNLIAFTGCIIWFHRLIYQANNKLILPVIMVYLASVIVCFIFSLMLENDYLDGLGHLITSAISVGLFWLWTNIALIIKHAKSRQMKSLLIDMAQTSILLLLPLLIVLMISNASFKIGG